MLVRFLMLLVLTASFALQAGAERHFLNVTFRDSTHLRCRSIPLDLVDTLTFRAPNDSADWYSHIAIKHARGPEIVLPIDSLETLEAGHNLPEIHILTDNPSVTEFESKTDYTDARFVMHGFGQAEDIDTVAMRIRLRGNSTAFCPKRPYRLKFDKKLSIAGLTKAKGYVLLADFFDGTLLQNATAMECARLLGMPFTNHMVPVNVYINGVYKGMYKLTEKLGISKASVDIDEVEGILWELDRNFDENYKFVTPFFGVKAQVKDPDFDELAEENPEISVKALWSRWKQDLIEAERNIYKGTLSECFDLEQMAKYFIVQNIMYNLEMNHPKSMFLYKERLGKDCKYKFGPVWDFDMFGPHYSPHGPLLHTDPDRYPGIPFLSAIVKNEEFRAEYDRQWEYFHENCYEELMAYIEEYARRIRLSALANGELVPSEMVKEYGIRFQSSEDFDRLYEEYVEWLNVRIGRIDTHPFRLLW